MTAREAEQSNPNPAQTYSLVDSHCHVAPDWYEPVETLLEQMDRNGVAQAVLIQLLGRFDNTYQQGCQDQYPQRFASVVGVDASLPDALVTVERLARNGARGLRLRPTARSPGADPLAIWRSAAEHGLPISCVGSAALLGSPEFSHLVATFPDLIFVLEHLGAGNRPDADDNERAARRAAFELAHFPNVYLKLPGLGELIPRDALPRDLERARTMAMPDSLQQALQHFGPGRMLWGSDFPVVSTREGYANALSWPRAVLASLRIEDQQGIFGDNARRIFRLS